MNDVKFVSYFGTIPFADFVKCGAFAELAKFLSLMPIYLKNKEVNNKVHFHRTYADRIPKKNIVRVYHDADFIDDIKVVVDVYEKRHLCKVDRDTGDVLRDEYNTYYYICDFGYRLYFWSDLFDELHMEELLKILTDVVHSFKPIRQKYAMLETSIDANKA